MKAYVVSLKLDSHLEMNSPVLKVPTEKEARAKAKDYFTGIFGKGRVDEALKDKTNVNVAEIEIEDEEIIQ